MRMISRREFIRGIGVGLGALGSAALLAKSPWGRWIENLMGVESYASASESTPPPPHARQALYYGRMEESLDCSLCHGEIVPSQVLYCHTSHNGNYIKCQLCPKGCIISEGHRGECRVRENRGGKLYTMVYGNPCAVHIDPIEKKPFYHFLPASRAFSLATAGCNLHCLYCQNHTISQHPPEETQNVDLPPKKVVELALAKDCPVIAYTYSEPTVFYEYMLETARLARPQGIKSVVVSAGYMNPEPLRELCQAVDAIKIDLKGFNEKFYEKVCFATLEPVLEAMKIIQEEGVHLEIVNLVVPTLNDDEGELREMARWMVKELGPQVPTHFSRFLPMYKLQNLPPTPVESLERARAIAMEEGIQYAYIGNVPGHPGDNTYCHNCGKIVMARMGFAVVDYHIMDGKCEYCGNPIPGVWGDVGAPRLLKVVPATA